MQRGHCFVGQIPEHRHLECVDVEVQYVEKMRATPQLIEHDHIVRYIIPNGRIETYRLFGACNEASRCHRIAAGEQSYIMTLLHQRLGQMGDRAFRPSVEPRRYAFHQRSYLCNSHLLSISVSKGRVVATQVSFHTCIQTGPSQRATSIRRSPRQSLSAALALNCSPCSYPWLSLRSHSAANASHATTPDEAKDPRGEAVTPTGELLTPLGGRKRSFCRTPS
jgi:hypothetical protein